MHILQNKRLVKPLLSRWDSSQTKATGYNVLLVALLHDVVMRKKYGILVLSNPVLLGDNVDAGER